MKRLFLTFIFVVIGILNTPVSASNTAASKFLHTIRFDKQLNGTFFSTKPILSIVYTCGSYNSYDAVTCSDTQICCRNYHTSNPYNYCCSQGHACDGEGGCR